MKKIVIVLSISLLHINFLWSQIPTFSNVTERSGINDVTNLKQPFGYGASSADFDNDGDIDFFLATDSGIPDRLYRNDGNGIFQDIAADVGLASISSSNVSLWFDYNGDRLLDIVVVGNCFDANCNAAIQANLYQQTTEGNFINTTEISGLSFENKYDKGNVNPIISIGGLSAADVNNDGYLDLLVTIWKGKNTFFLNNGNGTFSDISTASGFGLTTKDNWQAMFHDFNKDGLLDVYFAIDFAPNELWINKGNTIFEETASAAGVDNAFNEMGLTIGDYDNDGDMDMYATNITVDNKYNILLENNSINNAPSFIEVAKSRGVSENGWDWGTTFFDANNDGWLDLASTNGYISFPADKSKLWINNKDKSFKDASTSSGFNDELFATTLLSFDMDRDGDLDLLQTLKENEETNKPANLYENLLNENPNAGNYIVVKPRMIGQNHFSIGAIVKIRAGNLNSTRLITAGTSFYGQEPAESFFGLQDNTSIDEIRIKWPDNTTTILNDIQANQIITVTNEVVAVEVLGCTDPESCNYNPLATTDNGSCAYYSSGEILGSTESGFNKIETYTYDSNNNSQLTWEIEGGKLISGQGSKSIVVKWELNDMGRVSLSEQTQNCLNITKVLDVELNINNRFEDISIARVWNEALLEAIRSDFARPTVHARNLFHSSIAMYDIWAVYEGTHPYLLDNDVHNHTNTLKKFTPNEDIDESLPKAISYAVYRLLSHRFKNSPHALESLNRFNLIMRQLGYDTSISSTDYESGDAAAFGNYVAETIINYGLIDNSRESTGYDNAFYEPKNPGLDLNAQGNSATGIIASSRWQPLTFKTFRDQSGNLFSESTPDFLNPEWGAVNPFALTPANKEIFSRDGNNYTVYHNPEDPPELGSSNQFSKNSYKWNFSLVSLWSSHLDPTDGVIWDISPKSIGNIDINLLPKSIANYPDFYNELNGGDSSTGRSINPKIGLPYESQMVPRGDYTRVLAEFWADGPDSETPPGHWFTILNYVVDHELFVRKFNGNGNELSPVEWDIKTYFILGGAMHDAAVSAWSIKGWHDYIRPISAIRYMCELGQSTDNSLSNYHPEGVELKEEYIEVIESGDALSGTNNEHVGKIKLFAWRGYSSISNTTTDVVGVGWILAENWWPYQRPNFVTPPFAGFISGHSTFSRAAAEVLTLVTGDEYFPGGIGEFVAKKNQYLVFEKGPSVDVKLQWATYRDASDQTSLSRIWGGIHPPADDIVGRIIGEKVGIAAYNFAIPYFEANQKSYINESSEVLETIIFPNPVINKLFVNQMEARSEISIFSTGGQLMMNGFIEVETPEYDVSSLSTGVYMVKISNAKKSFSKLMIKK